MDTFFFYYFEILIQNLIKLILNIKITKKKNSMYFSNFLNNQ